MQTRFFALAIGAIYLLAGILGFIPALYTSMPAGSPHVDVTFAYGNLFGLFPTNGLHDAVHIIIGLAGVITASRLASARYFCITMFLVFGLLTVFGFVPTLDTIFGLIPIFGNDTWVNAASSLTAGYFGFVAPESTSVEPTTGYAQHV